MLYGCDAFVMWTGWLRWLCCLTGEAYPSYYTAEFLAGNNESYEYLYVMYITSMQPWYDCIYMCHVYESHACKYYCDKIQDTCINA